MVAEHLQTNVIKERFLTVNRDRLERTQKIMPSKNKDLLSVFPLLFHVNNPLLPGYIDDQTPCGIYGYMVTDAVINHAKKLWRGLDLKRQGMWSTEIEAIFLMGSCGTVAFNKKSDFDVWLCYSPKLDRDKLKRLQKKASRIEQWFDSVGLEVHFFLMNAVAFKQGKVSKLSKESSGTAQHLLLLDEFYRTSIWMAGKTPFWWYVPPAQEADYEKVLRRLIKSEALSRSEIIDFGALPDIPSGEFFGAAVWQIYKGIDSPHKSALKITLMESYADSHPKSEPLSAVFKQKVYDEILDSDSLDPYLMMLHRIESYLKKRNDKERLEVIRRCFYLKLALPLSSKTEPVNWRKKCVSSLVDSWQWQAEQVAHLDNKKNWRLEDVVQERSLLVMYLTKSYGVISKFGKANAKKQLIKQRDLSTLGRKLYSVFDRKVGKIEVFNRGIVDSLAEESVTLILLRGQDKKEHWRLYRGKVVGEQFKDNKPLKMTYGLIELVAWAYFNQLLGNTTQKLLYAPGSDVGNSELNSILDKFSELTEGFSLLSPESADLMEAAYLQRSVVFLNIGRGSNFDPNGALGKQLVSGELDVLNYGGEEEGAIRSLEHFFITSWKEIFVFKYVGGDGLAQWLCSILDTYVPVYQQKNKSEVEAPEVVCFDNQMSHVLAKRLTDLFKSALKSFTERQAYEVCYLFEAFHKYYVITYVDKKFNFEAFASSKELLDYFGKSVSYFRTNTFDSHMLQATPYPSLFRDNKSGTVQIFLHAEHEEISAYVLDEMGAMCLQKFPLDSTESVLGHFLMFLYTLLEQREMLHEQLVDTEIYVEQINCQLEAYKLTKTGFSYKSKQLKLPDIDVSKKYGIQVIGEVRENRAVFTFYCDNTEFNSAEWGNQIFTKVAQHVLSKRKDEEKYYIYIADLKLAPEVISSKTSSIIPTNEYLRYKKRLEESLNKALAKL